MRRDGAKESGATAGEKADDGLPELPGPSGGTRLGVLEDYIGFHLRIAQEASFRVFARRTGVHELKPGRFAAMTVIHNNPGISQGELGRLIERDKSSVTPLVQELERRGLVARVQSKTDRRSVRLNLTPAGETMLRRLMVHAVEHDRKLDEIVGDQKSEFLRVLRKIADTLA